MFSTILCFSCSLLHTLLKVSEEHKVYENHYSRITNLYRHVISVHARNNMHILYVINCLETTQCKKEDRSLTRILEYLKYQDMVGLNSKGKGGREGTGGKKNQGCSRSIVMYV